VERIGFIGVGEISKAMVEGLSDGTEEAPPISLSPRNAATAAELAERFPNAMVRKDNQEVVDHSDIVLIALRRADRHDALAGLRISAEKTIVNVIPGVAADELRRILRAPKRPSWPPSRSPPCANAPPSPSSTPPTLWPRRSSTGSAAPSPSPTRPPTTCSPHSPAP